jgi:predicted ArsR family transcriptional regulator
VMPEMRAIVELCRRMRTVAEIAALLKMPLGVVRVLLSDLADQGKIRVYGTGTGHGAGRPDRVLLERVLSGLRRL